MNATAAIVLTIICTSFAQVYQKKAAMRLQESRDNKTFSSLGFVFNPDLLFSGVLLATGFALWVFVLSRWDVSVAYPFLSLNLIVVMLCSKFIFSENIKRHQWIGACFIFGGVLLISGGDLI